MKIMEQKVFKNLIHDLGCTPNNTFKELRTYDNIRVIGLQKVDNKQYYNIDLLDEQGNDIDAKISFLYDEKYIDTDDITPISKMIVEHAKDKIKQQLNSIYGESILPTMRVYAHYEKETIEFKNVKTVYIQENYLMIVFEDDFKSIDLKDCKSTQY